VESAAGCHGEAWAGAPGDVALQGLLRDQEYVVLLAKVGAKSDVHAWQQLVLRIGHQGAQIDGAGGGIHRGVGEVQRALLAIFGTVGQGDLHCGLVLIGEMDGTRTLRLLHRRHIGRAHGEVHIERVELVNGGQQGRAGAGVGGAVAHDGAFGQLLLAGAAINGRNHLGVVEVDPRASHGRLGLLNCSGGGTLGGFVAVQLGMRDIALRNERAVALSHDMSIGIRRLGRGQVGQAGIKCRLVSGRIDLEQQLALFDVGTFLIGTLEQQARYARAHIGAAECR